MAERIPIVRLSSLLLPTTDVGVQVCDEHDRAVVAHALGNGHTFGVVMNDNIVGTVARISGYAMLPDGRYLLELEGTSRFEISTLHENGEYTKAKVRHMPEPIGNFGKARAASQEVSRLFHLYRARCGDGDLPVHLPVDPVTRSYTVASRLGVDDNEKQRLLELEGADERLVAEREILVREITVLDHLQSKRG
ncbi:MAG: LON peptidase substrate-binding domain-containing protein, partial [Actinomycetota bacterium]